ncbi:MAG TPA: metallophosphoesterase [Bacteroidota bacterium]|nr:metallophosphoesterase [Bacteroidota bacterium]
MIIVIGDIHAKSKEPFRSSILKFFDWIKNTYSTDVTLIQLGDLFDTSSPHNEVEFEIIEKIKKFKQVFLITGNHDTSKRQGNTLLPIAHHSNITVLYDLCEKEIENMKCLFLPYLYSDMKEKYEALEGKYDYIFTHITPLECAFGDEGIDLKLNGVYIHGHIHIQQDFFDKYNNQHYVLGVPIPTRHGEQDQKFRIMLIENKKSQMVEVPQYFTYETVKYGDEPKDPRNILNIIDAPSVQSVFEKYEKYYIREEGIQLLQLTNSETSEKEEFGDKSLKERFITFANENNIDDNLKNVCLNFL